MKSIFIAICLIFFSQVIKAQVPAGEKLVGLHNITTANTPSISSPVVGSLFYDSSTEKVMVYTTSLGWVPVASKSDLAFNSSTGVLNLTNPATTGNQVNLQNYVRVAPVKQVTANYTVTAADTGTVIYVNSATDVTITLPSGLPIGFNISVYQQGTGYVTFTGSGATVVNRLARFKTAGQYAGVGVVVYLTNQFTLTGDLK